MKLQRMLVFGLCLTCASQCFGSPQDTAPATRQSSPTNANSLADKIGVFVYPEKEQTLQRQSSDESACYAAAKQYSGVDPDAAIRGNHQQETAKGQAQRQGLAQQLQDLDTFRRAFSLCLASRGYSVKVRLTPKNRKPLLA